MIIPPLALMTAAIIGLVARGHRPVIKAIAVLAPRLSIVALVAQFVPGGAQTCESSTTGPSVCHALPAVSGWGGPPPFAIAGTLILLSVAPLISVRTGAWWLAAVSAGLQSIPQVISFGGFVDWAPALLATMAVAFAIAWSKPNEGAESRHAPTASGPLV